MLKRILSLASFLLLSKVAISQINEGGSPLSFQKIISGQSAQLDESNIANYQLFAPNLNEVAAQDMENDSKGKAYRVGINMPVNLTMQNAGIWTKMTDGTNVWRLVIESKNAVALGLYFQQEVKLPAGGKLFAYNENHRQIAGAYTSNTPSFEAMEMIQGEKLFLEYSAPSNVLELPVFAIKEVVYFYRGVQDHTDQFKEVKQQTTKAESCQVDVACSEGTNWQNQIKSVVHYSFSDSQGTYVCSGATINNTSQNCTPYLLTAWHCGERTAGSSISSWVFYWRYQKTSCATGSSNGSDPNPGSYTMTGGTVKASSGNGTMTPTSSQVAGSDFYLVQLNSSIPSTYQPYLAGWDRTNTAATSGVGIHHPAGSAKKISTYTSSLASSTYNGGSANAHWRVIWAATTNGHGVTEGGSSGSPIFNQNGRIVGQLSGGSSYCTSPTQPDLYGKIYYNWDQNGATTTAQLKAWLDPTNTGVTSLDGIAPPCSSTPAAPVAAFSASSTSVPTGTTVSFTDQSTNSPTSWSWSISPSSGWSYAGGTAASSQNPQVTFTNAGTYSVTLVATNAQGSDSEVKSSYIVVTTSTTPCSAASSIGCASANTNEYISGVTLGSINNTSGCSSYTSYTSQSTSVTKGSSYTITVLPSIIGQTGTTAYQGDEIAVWIDWNDNLVFDDATERVGYVLVPATSFSTQFQFTVPTSAATGSVVLRCRISYNGTGGDGPITSCGTTTYGEVEDYTVVIQASSADVTEQILLNEVQVVPNPFTESFTLNLSGISSTETVEIELLDISGKQISKYISNGSELVTVSSSELAQGMYQVRLSTGTSSVTKRIVKQ